MFNKRITMFAILFAVAFLVFAKNMGASPPPIKIMDIYNVRAVSPDSDIEGAWITMVLAVTNPTEECPIGTPGMNITAQVWPHIAYIETAPRTLYPQCSDPSLYGGEQQLADLANMLEPILVYNMIPISDIDLTGEVSSVNELFDALHDELSDVNAHIECANGQCKWVDKSIPDEFFVFTPMVMFGAYYQVGPPPVPTQSD